MECSLRDDRRKQVNNQYGEISFPRQNYQNLKASDMFLCTILLKQNFAHTKTLRTCSLNQMSNLKFEGNCQRPTRYTRSSFPAWRYIYIHTRPNKEVLTVYCVEACLIIQIQKTNHHQNKAEKMILNVCSRIIISNALISYRSHSTCRVSSLTSLPMEISLHPSIYLFISMYVLSYIYIYRSNGLLSIAIYSSTYQFTFMLTFVNRFKNIFEKIRNTLNILKDS